MSFLGLIFLWGFWHHLWKPQRVDFFRQRLFALRSDLFDIAANGKVSFEHPAYAQLRLMINGVIRYAHRASFPTLIVASVQSGDSPTDALNAWKKDVGRLPSDAQEEILSIYSRLSEAFASHIVGGSLTLVPYILLRVFWGVVESFLLLLVGKKDFQNFTVSRAHIRIDREKNQITRAGVVVIEERVLYEEQRRMTNERLHAYAL